VILSSSCALLEELLAPVLAQVQELVQVPVLALEAAVVEQVAAV
jgi:hypothetical protein